MIVIFMSVNYLPSLKSKNCKVEINLEFDRSSIDQSQVLLVRYRSCPCSTRIKGHWSNQDFVDIAFYQSYLLDKIFDLNRNSRYLSLMRSIYARIYHIILCTNLSLEKIFPLLLYF